MSKTAQRVDQQSPFIIRQHRKSHTDRRYKCVKTFSLIPLIQSTCDNVSSLTNLAAKTKPCDRLLIK